MALGQRGLYRADLCGHGILLRQEERCKLAVEKLAGTAVTAHQAQLIGRVPEGNAVGIQGKGLSRQGRDIAVFHIAAQFLPQAFLRGSLHPRDRRIHVLKKRVQREPLAGSQIIGQGGIGLSFMTIRHFTLGVDHSGKHVLTQQFHLVVHLQTPGAVPQRGQRDQMIGHAGGKHDVIIDLFLHGLVRHARELGIGHIILPDLRTYLVHLGLGQGRRSQRQQQQQDTQHFSHGGHFLPAILLHCIVYNEINFIASLLQHFPMQDRF